MQTFVVLLPCLNRFLFSYLFIFYVSVSVRSLICLFNILVAHFKGQSFLNNFPGIFKIFLRENIFNLVALTNIEN